MRLAHRVFLLCTTIALIAIGAMWLVHQQSFSRGFLAYVNALEHDRATRILPALEAEYRQFGWRRMQSNPMMLRWMQDRVQGEGPGVVLGPPLRMNGDQPRPGDRPRPRGDGPRLGLYDADGHAVIGPPAPWPDAFAMPIVIDGKTVGALYSRPLPQLENRWDIDFARAQTYTGLGTAAIAIALSLLGAWLLADRLARPVRALGAQAAAIARGDYRSRAKVVGRDEFSELATEFNAMAKALEDHRDARRRWTAEMSHELRTPIAVIQAELDALSDGVRPLNTDAVASLATEVERLSSLVGDLYQLSLADAGALDYRFEPVDLAVLVRDRCRAFAASFAAAQIEIELAHIDAVHIERGDQKRLSQLIDNLLANAERYTQAPGRVRVTLQTAPVRLCIENTPPGVDASLHERIFEPLFRTEGSRSRERGGAGLGLAIARRIAQAHGARLYADHSALGGLAVHLEWPT